MRRKIWAFAATALVSVAAIQVRADTTVVVSPSALGTWQQQNIGGASGSFVSGPGTPPLGTGSYQLSVGANGDDGTLMRSTYLDGTKLSDLTALSYSTYVQQYGSGGQAPYLSFNLDFDNDNVVDDQIFFEPVYQDATYFPSNPQATLTLNTWQKWDALNGGWWSNNGTGGGANPGTDVKSLATIIAAEPNAKIIVNAGLGGFRFSAGFGAPDWNNAIGNIDDATVKVGGGDTVHFNFEQDAVVAVPLPPTVWMGLTLMAGLASIQLSKHYSLKPVMA